MVMLSPEEQKDSILRILLYLDKICRENHIRYSLTGGTLLGAVRHQGFIPWDDDVDVFLIRPEYDKLSRILAEQKEYEWIATEVGNYHAGWGRLLIPSQWYLMKSWGSKKQVCLLIFVLLMDYQTT